MNLKERGITVGDILIIIIIIITTIILAKSINKNKKTTLNHSNHENIFHKKTPSSKPFLNKISL